MAYTLTFVEGIDCQISNSHLSSPYTLSNGDSIQVYSTVGNILTINGTEYKLSSDVQSIDISDTDINITVSTFPPAVTDHYLTINFSEATANRISVDMSTLSGWANLASGSHTLTIKAKADGYGTSDVSTGVTFAKAGAGYTLTVTAEEGRGSFNITYADGSTADVIGGVYSNVKQINSYAFGQYGDRSWNINGSQPALPYVLTADSTAYIYSGVLSRELS